MVPPEGAMIAIPLLAVLLLTSPQDSGSTDTIQQSVPARPNFTPEQLEQMKQKMEQAQVAHEPAQQTAIRINEMAGNIHSEADARTFVDAVAQELTGHNRMSWTTKSIRHSVAHAEYETV